VTLSGVCEDPGLFIRSLHVGWTIVPTHTFLFILSPEKAYERSKHRGEIDRFEVASKLEQFQQAFLGLVEKEPSRFTLVDAELPFEEIVSFVEEQIRALHLR
jgi:thymidylate kinase